MYSAIYSVVWKSSGRGGKGKAGPGAEEARFRRSSPGAARPRMRRRRQIVPPYCWKHDKAEILVGALDPIRARGVPGDLGGCRPWDGFGGLARGAGVVARGLSRGLPWRAGEANCREGLLQSKSGVAEPTLDCHCGTELEKEPMSFRANPCHSATSRGMTWACFTIRAAMAVKVCFGKIRFNQRFPKCRDGTTAIVQQPAAQIPDRAKPRQMPACP